MFSVEWDNNGLFTINLLKCLLVSQLINAFIPQGYNVLRSCSNNGVCPPQITMFSDHAGNNVFDPSRLQCFHISQVTMALVSTNDVIR